MEPQHTKVNDGLLAVYIAIFDPRRGKRRRFITFLVYDMVYPSISSNLLTLANLSPWSDSFCMHTCYTISSKPLLK